MNLSVHSLGFRYKSRKILNDISFSVPKGKITAILGPNGVGKTTLLKCLNRIHIPQKGEVRINGENIRRMSLKALARKVSYVAQKSETARLTVFDGVLMGRLPHMGYRPNALDIQKAEAVLSQLNLTEMGLCHMDELSGGELQKVAIARALVQESRILLMDEPCASLDLKNQIQILELLKKIVDDHGITMVITMHDINAALRYADQYICLKQGRIYHSGPISEICPKTLEAVYGIRVDMVHHGGYPIVIPRPETLAA